MASLRKRGEKWYAEVTKNGHRKGKSFATKAEASLWAAQMETELAKTGAGQIPDKTFGDLLDRYEREVTPEKRGARPEVLRLRRVAKTPIAAVKLKDFSEVHVYQWRDQRLTEVSSASVSREWEMLSAVCTKAYKEWKWLSSNPFSNVKKPKKSPARTRRVFADDIEKIYYALGYDENGIADNQTKRVAVAFLFAIETAMRAGEIVDLTWDHVHARHVHLPMTKNGHARDVPLSTRARELLAKLPKEGDRVFGLNSANLDAIFRRAKDRALITDLHFHDTRREALTRLAKKVPVEMLAKISGHRDLRILLNVYYAPKVDDMADMLD